MTSTMYDMGNDDYEHLDDDDADDYDVFVRCPLVFIVMIVTRPHRYRRSKEDTVSQCDYIYLGGTKTIS